LRTFSSTSPDLFASGPVVQISVGPSREMINALAPLGAVIRSPFTVTALIDTGAYSTVLNPETIARLGLKPVGVAPITTPSTTTAVMCNRYHINVYFAEDVVVENIFAIEAPMGGIPYHCLIGRDVLRAATLLYEGRVNRYTLSF
jgi:predicted aspartyl protease